MKKVPGTGRNSVLVLGIPIPTTLTVEGVTFKWVPQYSRLLERDAVCSTCDHYTFEHNGSSGIVVPPSFGRERQWLTYEVDNSIPGQRFLGRSRLDWHGVGKIEEALRQAVWYNDQCQRFPQERWRTAAGLLELQNNRFGGSATRLHC